uniref:Thiamin biosynthesis protein S n=1 Tax=Rhodomela confervoides TaxID=35163 RepID=A0A1Z1MAF5_RHOCN|nr:thiamin biosynthesis protein S [Rhodomela confervoides]ARW62785.1 thiamin biosynthesis protein S [Rhodomela confervoides]
MQNYLTIIINGDPFNCDESMSLTDILLYLNIDIHGVIIEYNSQIISKPQFDSVFFKTNDCIEIITIVGGG